MEGENVINDLPLVQEEIKKVNEPLNSENLATKKEIEEWKVWFLSQGYSLDSGETYYSFIKRYVDDGRIITQKSVDRFRESNKGCVSSSALKSFFKFLVNKKEFPESLLNIRFERNKQVRKMPNIISPEEVKTLVNSIESLKAKLMTLTIYELALRIEESLKLTWQDFNWGEWIKNKEEYGKVSLRGTKRGKFRVLPVKPEVMAILYSSHSLRDQNGIPIGGLLFEIWDSGTMLSFSPDNRKKKEEQKKRIQKDYLNYAKRTYREFLYRQSKLVLGRRINPHMLRHTKAQELMDNGMSIESISAFLGHSSIITTEIYARASSSKVKAELEKFDNSKVVEHHG